MADEADMAQELIPHQVRRATRRADILVSIDLEDNGDSPIEDICDGIRESLAAEVKTGVYRRAGVAQIQSVSVRPAAV